MRATKLRLKKKQQALSFLKDFDRSLSLAVRTIAASLKCRGNGAGITEVRCEPNDSKNEGR